MPSALEDELKAAVCGGKLFIGPSPDAQGGYYLLLADGVSFHSFAPADSFAAVSIAREEVKRFLGKWQAKAAAARP